MKIITIYEALGGGDERRAPDTSLGFFTLKSTADAAAEKQGWYGGPGRVQERFAIEHEGKIYLLDLHQQRKPIRLDWNQRQEDAKRRKTLLSRLSEEDRRVLGIRDDRS